jgi:hypothetical protein
VTIGTEVENLFGETGGLVVCGVPGWEKLGLWEGPVVCLVGGRGRGGEFEFEF